jgi:hypothetical protein
LLLLWKRAWEEGPQSYYECRRDAVISANVHHGADAGQRGGKHRAHHGQAGFFRQPKSCTGRANPQLQPYWKFRALRVIFAFNLFLQNKRPE